jgi:hypothetical protein
VGYIAGADCRWRASADASVLGYLYRPGYLKKIDGRGTVHSAQSQERRARPRRAPNTRPTGRYPSSKNARMTAGPFACLRCSAASVND